MHSKACYKVLTDVHKQRYPLYSYRIFPLHLGPTRMCVVHRAQAHHSGELQFVKHIQLLRFLS